MIVAFACRRSRSFVCVRYTGSAPALANGMSMSLCSSTTRPDSAAKSRMRSSAGSVRLAVSPATFEDTNSLWIVNSPMPVNTPGKRREHALDVIDAVHVGGVEPRDHRIEARLLARRERAIRHRDVGVRERVVVERRVGLQVVRGPELARVLVRPRLLQRNAEQGDTADRVAHDLQEPVDVRAFLNVVRQVEVRVVDLVSGSLRARRHCCRRRADDCPDYPGAHTAASS